MVIRRQEYEQRSPSKGSGQSSQAILPIWVGASLGVILRWKIGMALNAMFPEIPLGTWLANILEGCLIGVAIAFFGQNGAMAP